VRIWIAVSKFIQCIPSNSAPDFRRSSRISAIANFSYTAEILRKGGRYLMAEIPKEKVVAVAEIQLERRKLGFEVSETAIS
jgi:hypothetical protein